VQPWSSVTLTGSRCGVALVVLAEDRSAVQQVLAQGDGVVVLDVA